MACDTKETKKTEEMTEEKESKVKTGTKNNCIENMIQTMNGMGCGCQFMKTK